MSTISLPGLSTGIDTTALINQLLEVEKRTSNQLLSKKKKLEEKRSAMSELQSLLRAFKNASKELSDSSSLRGYKTATSDEDILTAVSSSSAFEGSHNIIVDQLAAAERIVHKGKAYAEDLVGEGKFIYSYNHQETVITTSASTTLQDLVGLINNDPSNPGITASLLKYDDGSGGVYHLVLAGNQSGAENTISINASNTNVLSSDAELAIDGAFVGESTKIIDLDQFSGTLGSNDKITITGKEQDGSAITPVELAVTKDTTIERLLQTITSAFGADGATATIKNGKILLTDNNNGSSLTELNLSYSGSASLTLPAVSVSTRGGTVLGNLAGFNSASDYTVTQQAKDARVRVDGYPAGAWINRATNTIDDIIPGVTLNLHSTGSASVNLTRQTDELKSKLGSLVENYNNLTQFIKEKTAYDKESNIAGILIGNYTVSTVGMQMRSPLTVPVSGFGSANDPFSMPADIGLELDKDGVLKLNSSKLDAAITKDYLGVLSLLGAAKTGTSSSSEIKFYASSNNTSGGTYNVRVTYNNGTVQSAQIKLSTENTWRDMSVDGNMITGNSEFDSESRPRYAENGLTLSADYTGTDTGIVIREATIQVRQGFAGKINETASDMLKTGTGLLDINSKAISDNISNLQKRLDQENDRLVKVKQRLVDKYARLERTLKMLEAQRSALSQS